MPADTPWPNFDPTLVGLTSTLSGGQTPGELGQQGGLPSTRPGAAQVSPTFVHLPRPGRDPEGLPIVSHQPALSSQATCVSPGSLHFPRQCGDR